MGSFLYQEFLYQWEPRGSVGTKGLSASGEYRKFVLYKKANQNRGLVPILRPRANQMGATKLITATTRMDTGNELRPQKKHILREN